MSDRFDLEQQILDCWNLTNELEHLNYGILEMDLTKDQIANVLTGLIDLYNIKFDKTFNTFTSLISERKIL